MRAALGQLGRGLRWLAHPPPWATASERIARAAIGMPSRHPERLTRPIRMRDALHMAAWSRQCWPANEYTAIIRDTPKEQR